MEGTHERTRSSTAEGSTAVRPDGVILVYDGDSGIRAMLLDVVKKAEKAGNKAFDKEIDELKDKIVKGCSDQEGKSYITKDADCYMKAKELKEWKTCDFQTPFFTDFSTLAETFGKSIQSKCDENVDKKGGKAGKKKGGDDD